MRSVSLAAALLVALAVGGCGTIRSLAGPDPAVGSHAGTYKEALAEAKGAHPERAAEYDAAWEALGVYLANDRSGLIPGVIGFFGSLLTPAGGAGLIGLATALVAHLANRSSKKAGDDAHDENAERIAALEARFAPGKPPVA